MTRRTNWQDCLASGCRPAPMETCICWGVTWWLSKMLPVAMPLSRIRKLMIR